MNEVDVMLVMDSLSQMFETLVKRIAALEREVDDLRSVRKKWINDMRPGVVIPPMADGPYLTQEEVNRILSEGTNETGSD